MIKVTGTINSKNGVAQYVNPILNIYMASPSKYSKTMAFAQVGKLENEGEPNENFTPVEEIFRNEYELKNPTFDNVQALLQADLEAAYPNLTFEIF